MPNNINVGIKEPFLEIGFMPCIVNRIIKF